MTLTELRTVLNTAHASLPVILVADGVPIRGGYHVTEFKQAEVASMTCGGDRDGWREARIEVMEGHGMGDHMPVGRFLSILDKVLDAMPGMADLPLGVEYGPGHTGLRLYDVSDPLIGRDRIEIPLNPRGAMCKATMSVSCCGAPATCCA